MKQAFSGLMDAINTAINTRTAPNSEKLAGLTLEEVRGQYNDTFVTHSESTIIEERTQVRSEYILRSSQGQHYPDFQVESLGTLASDTGIVSMGTDQAGSYLWAASTNNYYYSSTDGLSWSEATFTTDGDMNLARQGDGAWWIGSTNGRLYTSTDPSNAGTWAEEALNIEVYDDLLQEYVDGWEYDPSVEFTVDSMNYRYYMTEGQLARYDPSVPEWQLVPTGTFAVTHKSLAVDHNNRLWLVSDAGIHYSDDRGDNWTAFSAVSLANPHRVWISGSGAQVLTNNAGEIRWRRDVDTDDWRTGTYGSEAYVLDYASSDGNGLWMALGMRDGDSEYRILRSIDDGWHWLPDHDLNDRVLTTDTRSLTNIQCANGSIYLPAFAGDYYRSDVT